MDMIVDQMAKMHYMFGGRGRVPMVLRTNIGAGRGAAAQHSQSFVSFFMHIPGLYVATPSTPYDAKGLMIEAIQNDNPVIFIEHKKLYNTKGEVPEENYRIPFGKAEVKRKGRDVTIVATLQWCPGRCRRPRNSPGGIEVEVVDPRTLKPLDKETILDSVNRTRRLVVADEGHKTCGVAAEISACGRGTLVPQITHSPVCSPNTRLPSPLPLKRPTFPGEGPASGGEKSDGVRMRVEQENSNGD